MPDDRVSVAIATLVEVGTRTINVAKLILSEKLGASEVEVTLEAGTRFRLQGDDAAAWLSHLARFVPVVKRQPPARTKVIRRGVGEVTKE